MNKKTVVIGASTNPERYAFKAITKLRDKGHSVHAVALKPGKVGDVAFETEKILFNNVDTVTLYVGPRHQDSYYDYIISLKPQRVLFNPGTENPVFRELLEKEGISVMEACTLVLLSTDQY